MFVLRKKPKVMATMAKKNIFISYRVRDTQAATGRLVDALKLHFDGDQLFMDIDKIEPGLDFEEVIAKSLDNCDVMLAMIGPDWMALSEDKKTSRLHDTHDWVRQEIASALRRNIRVVPVLLEGAEMPKEEDLPEDLKPLLRRQSYEISNKRWQYDTQELIKVLKKTLGVAEARPQTRPTPRPAVQPVAATKSNKSFWVIAGAVAVLILLALIWQPPAEPVGPSPQPMVEQPSVKNVSGTWYDAGDGSRFVLSQDIGRVHMVIYAANNIQMGQGQGVIIGNWLTIDAVVVMGGISIDTKLRLELSADEQVLAGNVNASGNGANYTDVVRLVRQ